LQHATLSVAESATAGGLAERITTVPGASDYFVGGFITYTKAMKTEMLGIDPELLQRFGPVSKEIAEAMAQGARLKTGATYALSITGNAGPATDGDQAPVGMMYIGLATPAGVT
jgi:nicotinamide-nucleotide amidase